MLDVVSSNGIEMKKIETETMEEILQKMQTGELLPAFFSQ